MKRLWIAAGIGLLLCAAEGTLHIIGATTDMVLEAGMPMLGVFIILTILLSIQIAVRSHRQVTRRSPKPKRVRLSGGGGSVGDGGYVPVPVVFDVGCAPDGGSGGGGDGGASC